jgi:hypothetical protein
MRYEEVEEEEDGSPSTETGPAWEKRFPKTAIIEPETSWRGV